MLNPRRDPQLLNLGLASAGVVHLDECYAAGLSDDKVRWLCESGRWQSLHPRVFATFSGVPPYEALLFAAVFYAGAGAALSHATAGYWYRLNGRPPAIHLTVPYERDVARQPGLVLHRSRTLRPENVTASRPPYTSLDRTVIDLLATMQSADAALGLVGDAIRTRRTTAALLRVALVASSCTRWRKAVLDAMPDVERGAESPLELRDARLRRRHGLPAGRRQLRRIGDGTELLDVVIEEWRLHIELDGRLGHDATRERWRDMRRDNRSELSGLRHLRYGWADVVDRPCQVAIEQAQVLRRQGWRGQFRACRRCPQPLPEGL